MKIQKKKNKRHFNLKVKSLEKIKKLQIITVFSIKYLFEI